jgi:hypothetical protein
VLFTVPSRYWFPIGRRRYLALGRGRPRFRPDSACPALLTISGHQDGPTVAYGVLTLCDAPFQRASADRSVPGEVRCRALHQTRPTPSRHRRQAVPPPRFGLPPVRSPLLGESSLLLALLRCFSSRGCLARLNTRRARACPARVAPFGYPRIAGRQRLPGAFRRVTASFLGRQRLGIPHAPFMRKPHAIRFSCPGSLCGSTARTGSRQRGRAHLPIPARTVPCGAWKRFLTLGGPTLPCPWL